MTDEYKKNLVRQQKQQEKDKHDREMLNLSKRRNAEQERHQRITQNLNQQLESLINAEPVGSNEMIINSYKQVRKELEKVLDECGF